LDWRPLVKSQLQTLGRKQPANKLDSRHQDIRLLKDAISRFPDLKDQMTFWCQKAGKSRASFYRNVARYREED
jgi:hypothetical protein